jgi:hypothetical protein
MSTRATYSFQGDQHGRTRPTTIYIHYDGYPEGAAYYFWQFLHVENKRGGLATQFIRANDTAELTDSHECHGDTEYRYSVQREKDGTLMLTAKKGSWDADTKWTVFFVGEVAEFVNQYGKESIEGFSPLVKAQIRQYMGEEWVSQKAIETAYDKAAADFADYTKRQFTDSNPNLTGALADMQKFAQMLKDYDAPTTEALAA